MELHTLSKIAGLPRVLSREDSDFLSKQIRNYDLIKNHQNYKVSGGKK